MMIDTFATTKFLNQKINIQEINSKILVNLKSMWFGFKDQASYYFRKFKKNWKK